MDRFLNFLAVGAGGALGSILRYGLTLLFAAMNWSGYLAIVLVNMFGSFAIGYISGSVRDNLLLLLLTAGVCGGFTTFSTFSMQSLRLIQEGRLLNMGLYVAATVIVCVAAAWLGFRLAR